MSDIYKIHQFGFSAFSGSPLQPGCVAGFTALSTSDKQTLVAVNEADETSASRLFNVYMLDPECNFSPLPVKVFTFNRWSMATL